MARSPWRPQSERAFIQFKAEGAPGLLLKCSQCQRAFSSSNTHSPAGWRDTQIVGWCEECYDKEFPPE